MRVDPLVAARETAAAHAPAPAPSRREVPLERTPSTPAAIRGALGRAVERVTGRAASPAMLDVLVAHVSLETGRGRSMYNYNFGGIKGTGPSGLTAVSPTHEYVGGQRVATTARFRAYGSLDEGATDYVSLLTRRYDDAVDAAGRGDPDGFTRALHAGGYFTSPPERYGATLRALCGMPPPPAGAFPPAGAAGAATAAAPGDGASGVMPFPDTTGLARLLDAVAAGAARIAAPERAEDDES